MDDLLFGLLLVKLTGAIVLLLVGGAMLGRKLGDMRYQRVAGVNGVRRIQALVNVRTQGNRVVVGIAFLVVCIVLLVDLPGWVRVLVSRAFDCILAIGFIVSVLYDWRAEDKQLDLITEGEKRA